MAFIILPRMEKAMPLDASLRRKDLDSYINEILECLNKYIARNENNEQNSWLIHAKAFRNDIFEFKQNLIIEPPENETLCLISLKEKLLNFSQKILSVFQWSSIKSQTLIRQSFLPIPFNVENLAKSIGTMIGAKGSKLREDILAIAQKINPHEDKYDEDDRQRNLFETLEKQTNESVVMHSIMQSIALEEFIPPGFLLMSHSHSPNLNSNHRSSLNSFTEEHTAGTSTRYNNNKQKI